MERSEPLQEEGKRWSAGIMVVRRVDSHQITGNHSLGLGGYYGPCYWTARPGNDVPDHESIELRLRSTFMVFMDAGIMCCIQH
jgi:hypothetical protein